MISIDKIKTSAFATNVMPTSDKAIDSRALLRFDGEPKGHYSPDRAFLLNADRMPSKREFCNLARGVLVGSVSDLCDCEDMFYATVGTERLSVFVNKIPFIAINPTESLDKPPFGDAPCRVDRFYCPLFRLSNFDPQDIFCVSGFEVPMDEFRVVYDLHAFRGLEFETVWAGPSAKYE